MKRFLSLVAILGPVLLAWLSSDASAEELHVDITKYNPACGVVVDVQNERITVQWPLEHDETGRLVIDLREGKPLFEGMAIAARRGEPFRTVLTSVDPVTFVVIGERRGTAFRPPGMSDFNEFFDSPASRPFQAYRSRLDLKRARVFSQGRRATVALGDLSAGPFTGIFGLKSNGSLPTKWG